jgi:hypothetical protein
MSDCNHENRVCKNLKWGKSQGVITRLLDNRELVDYLADVQLWFCNDCKRYMYYDWHTREMTMLHKEYTEVMA